MPRIAITALHDARITATFESHTQVSNGRTEGRVFALTPAGTLSPELLRALPLECLAALPDAPDALRMRAMSADETFEMLATFAYQSGVYNSAQSGAYGRFAAWRSLAGLVDAPPDAGLEAIEALAHSCSFAWFDADAPWFDLVVTDLGIAALRPGGASVAVLAGTDSD